MAESSYQFVFLIISIILVAIKVVEHVMDRFEQPRVLGEVMLGILFGPSLINLISISETPTTIFESLLNLEHELIVLSSEIIEFMAEVGVLFLLFEVGLEVEFDVLKKVGRVATGAAFGGILVPLLGGLSLVFLTVSVIGSADIIPTGAEVFNVAFFLGAALTATSVGISIRVFVELNTLNSRVARSVVGAAVIDDIISILLLTLAITYHEEAAALGITGIIIILAQIISFFIISAIMYRYVMPWFVEKTSQSTDRYLPLITGLVLVFFFAWLASTLQLAGIIGAFVAGLLINQDSDFAEQVKSLFSPISHWVVPFFFLGVGLRVDLFEALSPRVLLFALLLTVVALITKIIGGILGTWFTQFEWHESQLIGIAMSARGEVTLIFAATALSLGLFSQFLFSAMVFMVIINAVIVPPLLKHALNYWEANPDVDTDFNL